LVSTTMESQRARSDLADPRGSVFFVGSSVGPSFGTFFYQFMSSLDYQLIDLIQNLRCEKTQVVLDRLQVVCRFVLPTPMLEHPANGVVMAGQLMNSIIIGVEAQTQRAENQDLPLFHPGTPKTAVRFLMSLLVGKSRTLPGRNEPCQNLEYGFA